jgi:hypothetical protein
VDVDDFAPLPNPYILVETDGGCGNGSVPVDCSRTATIEFREDIGLGDLHDHLEDRGWEECDSAVESGRCYWIVEDSVDSDAVVFVFSHIGDPGC